MKSSEIPSRKGVHFRNTSSKNEVAGNVSANQESVSLPSKISGKTSHSPVQNEKDTYIRNSKVTKAQSSVIKKTSRHINENNTKDTIESRKTPAEMSREKELSHQERVLSSRLSAEVKKTGNLKKELRNRSRMRFKKKIASLSIAVLAGALIFALLSILILFFYYRSITKYSGKTESFTIRCYEYLNPHDTSKSNTEKLEARKEGTEKPLLNIDDQIVIKNSSAYIPLTAIKDYLDLAVAGNGNSRTLTTGSTDSEYTGNNTVHFTFDSCEITVNGSVQMLQGAAFIYDNEFYFPYEFIESYVRGISIDKSVDGNHTDISITKTSPNIYFGGSSNDSLMTPDFSEYFSDSLSIHEYTIDVSAYEKYISPDDGDKYLLLVNKTNMLSEDYVPKYLTNVITNKAKPTQQICFDAAMALKAMLLAADAAGYGDLTVDAGYKSYSYQSSLYNSRLNINLRKYDKAEAERLTSETIIYPGTSDHQTGLAIDLHNLPKPMQTFANSDEYRWLIEHCADFGFILRYPQTKENITGVKYEPWHFRFVGRKHAQAIMSQGLTLEEYVANYKAANE